jgi:hypothetical protein
LSASKRTGLAEMISTWQEQTAKRLDDEMYAQAPSTSRPYFREPRRELFERRKPVLPN